MVLVTKAGGADPSLYSFDTKYTLVFPVLGDGHVVHGDAETFTRLSSLAITRFSVGILAYHQLTRTMIDECIPLELV